ncbi:unnamed protein product [Camellia sinensis]
MEASVTGGKEEDNKNNNVATGYSSNNVKKARLQSTMAALLNDPILTDVPKKPTLSDVDNLISLELGSAMRISILKLDGTSLDVVVMNSTNVKDLKMAIKRKTNDMEQSKMGHRHISWKHVWANFCLSYHNEKLLDDNSALQDYGIRNNSQCAICSLRHVEDFSKTFKEEEKTQFLSRSQQNCLKTNVHFTSRCCILLLIADFSYICGQRSPVSEAS